MISTKQIQDVQPTKIIDGSDKLLIVKSGNNKSRSVTVDDFIHENSISTGEINDCAITEPKISDGAISTRHMTANTIDGCVVTAGTLDAGKITTGTLDASRVNVTNLNASSINSGTLDANSVNVTNLNANNITSGTICGDLITGLTVNAACITGLTITANDITSGTLDASVATITNLDADNITTGSLDANRIGSNTIVSCHIDTCSIQSCHIVAGSIDAGKIAANAVGATAIAAGSVAANALESNIIIAGSIQSSNFGNFGINLDTDFMSIENGKVTITRIPSDTVVDQSLFLTPNTIFFGQSETQEFELPTFNQRLDFFGTDIGDTTTWSLSPTTVFVPNLYSSDQYKFDYFLNTQLVLYHENDFRNVGIYNSGFVSDSVLPVNGTREALDDKATGSGAGVWYNPDGAGVVAEHVLMVVDLQEYGINAAQVNGNLTLNNVKIKYDTSKTNILSLIESFNLFNVRTYWSSTTAIHSDQTQVFSGQAARSTVKNPTVIGDVFETIIDLNIGHPQTAAETGGNAQRFATVVLSQGANVKTLIYQQ